MRNVKRNVALVGSSAVIAAVGLGGVISAQADTSGTPAANQAETAQEGAEAEDGPDQGPDANPNEPGHQDADESGEAEGSEAEDGPDQGPDANPNEPGHQDADDAGDTD